MADRDPDAIKQDIDAARDQLAATVDSLAERANPRRLADDLKAKVIAFVTKPAVAAYAGGRRCPRRRGGGAPGQEPLTRLLSTCTGRSSAHGCAVTMSSTST